MAKGDYAVAEGVVQAVAIKRLRCVGGRQRDNQALLDEHFKIIEEHFPKWVELRHKNINPVLDMEISTDALIINPWIQYNLFDVLYSNERRSAYNLKLRWDKWSIIKDVCDGLEYLHTQTPRPITHGGLGTKTVLIDDSNGVVCAKLSNFGLDPILRRFSVDGALTMANEPTEYTRAPEVVNGVPPNYEEATGTAPPGMEDEEDIVAPGGRTPASDIYDLGTLMLEILSEKTPWVRLSRGQCFILTITGKRPSPADHPGLPVGHPAWDLIQRCWSQDARARPNIRVVSEVVDAIRQQVFNADPLSEKYSFVDSQARL